jgi:hypothetical protein
VRSELVTGDESAPRAGRLETALRILWKGWGQQQNGGRQAHRAAALEIVGSKQIAEGTGTPREQRLEAALRTLWRAWGEHGPPRSMTLRQFWWLQDVVREALRRD